MAHSGGGGSSSRYIGTLHKLCENGPHKKGGWTDLLTYLEVHSLSDPQAKNPAFDSPLAPYTAPSPSLAKELIDRQGARKEDTPLRIICKTAPSHILAAVLHLGPAAATIKDSRGRLPLHLTCRRPTSDKEDERALKVVVLCYPPALLARDDGGRTPLHYLLWYHASTRSTRLVEHFLVPLPVTAFDNLRQPSKDSSGLPQIPSPTTTAVPPTAAIVPDSKHGCLPLHYAVMEGASKDVVKLLIQTYPASKVARDKLGRVALSWYLGAGMDHQHVSGEAPDPNAVPLYSQKKSTTIISLLLNSKSARSVDHCGRCPLHWAAHLLGLHHHHHPSKVVDGGGGQNEATNSILHIKVIQSLLDHYVEATTLQDSKGLTPLHVLFDVVAQQQELEWHRLQRNKTIRDTVNLHHGGGGFNPPLPLLELLLRNPTPAAAPADDRRPHSAAHMEDPQGHLPLHLALLTAPASPSIVQLLIQAHPTALVHTTEEVQTPLHCALLHPYSAPLQTAETIKVLLQAYVTSRHGTFVNGKLALKMEDSAGQFPLHYAAFHHACLDVMHLLLETYPKAARLTNADGDLPLHCLLDAEYLFESSSGTGRLTGGATLATPMGWISESETEFHEHQLKVHQECMALLVHQLLIFPIDRDGNNGNGADSALHPLHIASSAHGMLPLHIVVAFDAVDYSTIYSMLDQFPESAMAWTTGIPGHKYTALDLHEMRRTAAEKTPADNGISTVAAAHACFAKWMNVRELLFAFGPNVAELRHKEDLLEQCARVVRDEAEGKGSTHATEFMALMEQQLQQQGELELKQTLSTVEAPRIDRGFKPKREIAPSSQGTPSTYFLPKNKGKPASAIPPIKVSTKKGDTENKKEKPKSIYDDDEFDHRYTVSKDEGDEDGDDYFDDDEDFLGDEEYDESYRSADDFDEEYDDDDDSGTYGSYTYDSRTFDDTIDSRTIDSRTIDSRTIDSRTIDSRSMDTRTLASKRQHKEHDVQTLVETESQSLRRRKFDGSFEEEKKEEEEDEEGVIEVPFLSDVAMRLWTFFVLFRNLEDARDNYSNKVEMILAEVPFPTVKELTSLLLPPYAQQYLPTLIALEEAKTLEEVAHNACKAVIHRACYFIGRYEFQASAQDSLVMHHTDDDTIVCVRATEHSINIEEVIKHEEETGKAEEDIWKTGAADEFIHRTVKSVFQVTSRKVCIKFMRSQQAYFREVQCRQDMGITVEGADSSKNFVVPLINHFSSVGESTRPEDTRFKFDVKDERFKTLDLGGGETIAPSNFPYAVVLPFRDDGDLFDYFLHHGRLDKTDIREIGLQVGKALQAIHQKGLVHGNVSLQSIALVAPNEDSDEMEPYWALTDLSGACNQSTSLMAGIPSTGAANFMTCSFPPELYVKLGTPEVKIYNAYWDTIKTKYNVDVDPTVVAPHVDPATGDSHVLRCHYEPDDEDAEELPPLPYKLVPAREPSDVWSFGRVMFTLCTAGHPMFPTNIKTGHLLAYDQVANFDRAKARELIYKHVEDPLAQDLLFHLLSNYEQRSVLTMEKILNHPFFCSAESDSKSREKVIQQIAAHRSKESVAYMRSLQERNMKQAEGEWVTHRSKNLHCWSLDISMRMHLAPSTLLRLDGAPDIPYGVVLLPYKLARNKAGKLTPSTKKDVERAEKMGIQLLALVKACQFAARMETIVEDPKYFGKTWTSSDIVSEMFLYDDSDYEEHKKLLIHLAAAQVEQFRDDPMVVARRIVQQRIVEVQDCIVTDSPEAWLYLVDEFAGIPVLAPPYPMKVTEKALQVMQRTLPLMHLSVLYTCAVAGSIAGLVKLIFEAAYPHLPPSWTAASEGIKFALNKTDLEQQVAMLRASLAELYSLDKNNQALDDVKFLRNYLEKRDTKNSYAKMKRVTNGEAAMWTTSVENIEEECKDHDIYQEYNKQKELQEKLEKQELRINELEKALEIAEFKRKHNIIDVIE